MTEKEYQEFLSNRREAGKLVDPTTAKVTWKYANVLDPYGIDPELDECCIGREYFARSATGDWVCFCDLPEATEAALWERIKRDGFEEDLLPWEESEDDAGQPSNGGRRLN